MKKVILKGFCAIALLFVFLNTGLAQRFNAVNDEDTLNLASLNMQALQIKNLNSIDLKIFDSLALSHNVFFIGENHTYRSANSDLQLAFIKYLNEKAGVRHIIMEFGFARSWLVNQYINSSDTSLSEVLRLYSYKEYADYYEKLRQLNLSLPLDKRLSTYGIDIERFNHTPLKVLSLLLPKKEVPDSIALAVESLKGIAGYLDNYQKKRKENKTLLKSRSKYRLDYSYSRSFNSEKTARLLVNDFIKHENYFKEYLSKDTFALFKKIIGELKDQIRYEEYERTPFQHVFREQYMYNKFTDYAKLNPNSKFFGQFGRCHVAAQMQDNPCNYFSFKSITSRINSSNNPWFRNKVAAIAYFYVDDESYERSIETGGKVQQVFNRAKELDTIVAIEVMNDTVLFGDFHSYYDFLIFDRRTKYESSSEYEEEDWVDESEGNFSIFFAYQRHQHDLSTLNNFLIDKSYSALTSDFNKLVFGIEINSTPGFCFNWSGFASLNQESHGSLDTTTLTYQNGGMTMDFGWNFFSSKYFLLKPMLGFGFSASRLSISESDYKSTKTKDFFGGNDVENFMTTSFIIDPGLEMILKWKLLGIGIKSGYIVSPFKSHWRNSSGEVIPVSPKFTSNGFYLQAGLYLMFDF